MSNGTARAASTFAALCSMTIAAVLAAAPAQAHPLGNFTINHLAKITAGSRALRVRYILDIAEIPTFQILHQRNDGRWDTSMLQQWAAQETSLVRAGLAVRVDGRIERLHTESASATLRPGAGGLPLIRWVGLFDVPFETFGLRRVHVDDTVYADRRIGWKDIIAGAQTEPTRELTHYPSALLGSPRRVRAVTFAVTSAGTIASVVSYADPFAAPASLAAWISPGILSELFARTNQTPLFVLFTLLAAFGLGSLHGIEPGHGKALLAFTLVGSRATIRQAMILALSLTFAHTAGVLLLGLALFFAAGFATESIYPWITIASGIGIAVIGGRGFSCGLNRSAIQADAQHDNAVPARDDAPPLKFRSAVFAAMSGGIAPCPAAIVVLLTALHLHRLGYGLVLIVLFSLGLAAILSGIGIGVVRGAAWLSQTSGYERLARFGPLFSASIISIIGAWTLAQGFVAQGVNAPPLAIAALTLCAIAGYALSRRGAHHGHSHNHAHFGMRA